MGHVPAEACKAALQLRMFLLVLQAAPAPLLSSPACLGWSVDTEAPQEEAPGAEKELQTAAALTFWLTGSRGSRPPALFRDDRSEGVCIVTTKAESCWFIFYFPVFRQWGVNMCSIKNTRNATGCLNNRILSSLYVWPNSQSLIF